MTHSLVYALLFFIELYEHEESTVKRINANIYNYFLIF